MKANDSVLSSISIKNVNGSFSARATARTKAAQLHHRDVLQGAPYKFLRFNLRMANTSVPSSQRDQVLVRD